MRKTNFKDEKKDAKKSNRMIYFLKTKKVRIGSDVRMPDTYDKIIELLKKQLNQTDEQKRRHPKRKIALVDKSVEELPYGQPQTAD